MPAYKYVCSDCGTDHFVGLPISFNPDRLINCSVENCSGQCSRRIGFQDSEKNNDIIIKKDGTLGQWYKNKTGKELLGGE